MFGILYTLFGLGVNGVNKIKESVDDSNNREKAKRNGELTYYGKNGQHLVSNGRLIHRGHNHSGDEVVKDMYNGKIYVNLSEEERKKIIDKALQEGRTVVDTGSYDHSNPFYRYFKDKWWFRRYDLNVRYIDIETKKYFRRVCINGYYFYMDIETGLLVRKSDPYIDTYRTGDLSEDEIITIFNRRQLSFKGREKVIGKPQTLDNRDIQKMYYLIYNDFVTMDKFCKLIIKEWSRYTRNYIVTDITQSK